MKEDWTEQMRKKLEHQEMEPPPGTWEAICERLGIDPEPASEPVSMPAPKPVSAKKTTLMKRWYWAVAAVVLALTGVFVAYQWGDDEAVAEAEKVSNEVSKKPVSSRIPEKAIVEEAPAYQMLAVQGQKKDQGEGSHESEAKPESTVCPPDSKDDSLAVAQEMADEPQTIIADEPQTKTPTDIIPDYPSPQYEPAPRHDPSADTGKWTIGLNASGGLLAANYSAQTDKLYYKQSMVNSDIGHYYNGAYSAMSYTVTEHLSKHRLPVRFGLSLHYQLSPRLALLSGISYTRLYSEFSYPLYQNISYSQRLHYIGVPFGVAWQLWKANHFSVYLTGGAMVEKCVSVSLDGDYTGKKPWQWSVNGAVGAEYAFTSLLGAYIEPSLGYYFSDGTQLEHYYKEHPLAPSIEFGLRLHVGK